MSISHAAERTPHEMLDPMCICRCVECRMDGVERDLNDIKGTLELIKTTMLRADTTIATIAGEVKPTLDALMGNPALRMFLGVKKGDKL